jgi:hypothetical protein
MSAWNEILIAFGGNAVLLGVLGVLARSLFQTWLAKDIKRFEADLKNTADSELERLKFELKAKGDASIEQLRSQLQQSTLEHQVRFSKLHERRASLIEKVYARLVDARLEGKRFIVTDAYNTDQKQQLEAMQRIRETMRKVAILIDRHRIYFPEHICKLLQKLSDSMSHHVIATGVYAPLDPQQSVPENQQTLISEKHDVLLRAYKAFFSDDIPAATKALEDEFRNLLGVETSHLVTR